MKDLFNFTKPVSAPERRLTHAPRLLVVDDEEVICQLVQGYLGVEGWEVDSVGSIDEAIAMLGGDGYPVVLCDVHLPGNSTDLLRLMKERFPASQVIMFTGDPTISTAREAIQYGAYEYVPKPCRREELVRIVYRAYDKYILLREQDRLQTENALYREKLEELVEKKKEQLRESELRYRAIFNRAMDAILLVDPATGTVWDHNIAATRLLNVGPSELMNRSVTDFFGVQLADVMKEAGHSGHHEWRLDRVAIASPGSKQRTAQVFAAWVEFDRGACLQVVARDITDQLEMETRTAMIENELVKEQRLANIGLLASGIAHNINTPLMGIYGAAQLAKMKHPELDDFDGVISQVERINAIIRNLMWKSRQEQETRRQEIDLNELLREELKFLEADMEYKHNVEKEFALADDVPAIMGRYSDFSQSLMNIVRNAIDSMHDTENKKLTISSSVKGGEIRVVISDTGCGISPEVRDKMFLPFFTTKPLVGHNHSAEPTGTGLGLSTAKKLMSPYGVRFEIDSAVGAGTTFTVIIPISSNSGLPDPETEYPES